MSSIMSYLTGFGLAGGAGTKAFIPVLLLGGLHYTDYFELAPRFEWIASPPVMVVLGLLVILEIIVDANPDLGHYTDAVQYLPKMVTGFIAFAAATGEVDDSVLELGASGLLGSTTAVAMHWIRNRVRQPFRYYVEDLHGSAGKAASLGEAGASAMIAGSAVVAPVLAIGLLVGLVLAAFAVAGGLDRRRVPCVHCGEPIRPGAIVCVHCKREQAAELQAAG